jgi:hypothetical protein
MKRLIPIVALLVLSLSAGCSSGRGRTYTPEANSYSTLGITPAYQSTSRYSTNTNYDAWHQSGNLSLARCRQLCDQDAGCPDECADYVYQDGLRGVDLDSNLYPTIGMRGALGPFNRLNGWAENQGIRSRVNSHVFQNDMGRRVQYRSAYLRNMREMNGDYCQGLCEPDGEQFLDGSESIKNADEALYEYECHGNSQRFQSLMYEFDPDQGGRSGGHRGRSSAGCSGTGASCGGSLLSGLAHRFENIGKSLARTLIGSVVGTAERVTDQLSHTGLMLQSGGRYRGSATYRQSPNRDVYSVVRPKVLAMQHLRYFSADEACEPRNSHFAGFNDACGHSDDEQDDE